MWYLIPIAGLVAVGIAALASHEETEARASWEHKHRQAEDEVRRHRQEVAQHLAVKQDIHNFYVLNEAYYCSYKAADNAYALLRDAKTCLAGIKKMLGATEQQRRELNSQLRQLSGGKSRMELVTELDNLAQLKTALTNDFNQVLAQKRSLYQEVTLLNQQTEALKRTMASQCGQKGLDWHCQLQQRIANRRGSASTQCQQDKAQATSTKQFTWP